MTTKRNPVPAAKPASFVCDRWWLYPDPMKSGVGGVDYCTAAFFFEFPAIWNWTPLVIYIVGRKGLQTTNLVFLVVHSCSFHMFFLVAQDLKLKTPSCLSVDAGARFLPKTTALRLAGPSWTKNNELCPTSQCPNGLVWNLRRSLPTWCCSSATAGGPRRALSPRWVRPRGQFWYRSASLGLLFRVRRSKCWKVGLCHLAGACRSWGPTMDPPLCKGTVCWCSISGRTGDFF